MQRVQHVRVSQFVTTYGPGAILEAGSPRVMLRPDLAIHGLSTLLPRLEINFRRMSSGLLDGGRIFRVPSNAELGKSSNDVIYHTNPFPSWFLCWNAGKHSGGVVVLYRGQSCPRCQSRERANREPVRFIRACPAGHMDDIDWPRLVHVRKQHVCHQSDWFVWEGGGGTASRLVVSCPQCKAERNLGEAYGSPLQCSGRFPEQEDWRSGPRRPGCPETANVMQRGAANLRVPELRTLFSVEASSALSLVLENDRVREHMQQLAATFDTVTVHVPPDQIEASFTKTLDMLRSNGHIDAEAFAELRRSGGAEIRQLLDAIERTEYANFERVLMVEFEALRRAAREGSPPRHAPPPRSTVIFEMRPEAGSVHAWADGVRLRVTPIPRLRTVTVQLGYRRVVGTGNVPAQLVDIGFHDGADKWYPGVDFLGEGLFITLDEVAQSGSPPFGQGSGAVTAAWESAHRSAVTSDGARNFLFRSEEKIELHPLFVWWHTLAHMLIRSIAVEAGYSAASIRERVYVDLRSPASGGIILYATQPGSEGTMGGLVALAGDLFEEVIDRVRAGVLVCSNDPICRDKVLSTSDLIGASCYACTVLPETSCEHRNLFLDRNLLAETL